MMRKAGLCALVTCMSWMLVGCNAVPLKVRITPADADIQSVTANGTEMDRVAGSDGLYYLVKLSPSPDQPTQRVEIKATSKQGVEADPQICTLTKGEDPPLVEVDMPAKLKCRLLPSSEKAKLKINGVAIEKVDEFQRVKPGQVVIEAWNKEGTPARQTIQIRGGERKEISLDTEMAPIFTSNPKSVKYEQEVSFDASGSTPTGTIEAYTWDYGDNTLPETKGKDDPKASHKYKFDPSKWAREQAFTVKLTIQVGGEKKTTEQRVQVSLPEEQLAFDVAVFPSQRHPLTGETVQFKITPRNAASLDAVEGIVFSCGDGTTTSKDAAKPMRLEREGKGYKPLVVSHVYPQGGQFDLQLTYTQPKLGLTTPQTATLHMQGGSPPTVKVTSAYLTDEELLDRAWQDFFRQFKEVVHAAGCDKRRLAISSMTSANYEIEEPDFVPVVDRLTQYLVEDANKYFVVEKTSQVLARLAPESIVDIRKEYEQQKDVEGAAEPKYRDSLDYGLMSGSSWNSAREGKGSRWAWLLYGLRIAGIENRIRLFNSSVDTTSGQSSLANTGQGTEQVLTEHKAAEGESLQNLPILMARFKTAEVLIALKILSEPAVAVTGPDKYDEALREELMTRTATVKVHVRLLERTGQVQRAVDIQGRYSETIPRSHLPTSKPS